MKNLLAMSCTLVLTLALSLSARLDADSPCKGLSQSECQNNDKCTWVSGYTQKDGDKVKAYCRAKPGQANSDKKSDKKKAKSDETVKAEDDKAEKKDKKKSKKKDKSDTAESKSKEDKKDSDKNSEKENKKDKKDKKDKKKKKKSKKDE